MGFPENVLAQGEKVERSIHPHWLTVAGPTLVGLVLLVGAIVVAWLTPDDTTGNRIQWVVVVVLVLLALFLVVKPFLRWRTTHYVITSHRVMVRRGILSKSGKDITLSKITDVSFAQTLLDRIINSGSLRIESAGDSPDEALQNIPHSNEVQQIINRLIDEDDNRRRMVADGRAAHGRSGYGDDEWAHDPEGMPPSPERRPRDRPELAEERRRPPHDLPGA
ncbi:MAG: PH domain-containing protein [Dermatophilaceae bacterium]